MALIHARNSPTSLSFSPCCFFFFFFFFCFILGTRQLEARPPQKPESDRESTTVASSGPSLESIRSTIVVIEEVTNVVSKFAHASGFDFRLSNAILDCLELLDYSAEELNWTLSSIPHKPSGNNGVDGHTNSDAAFWLGAAFSNQETCIDGFEGTNSLIKGVVTSSVNQITPLVHAMLRSLHHTPGAAAPRHSRKNAATDRRNLGASTASGDQFPPPWIKSNGDRKLLQQGAPGGVNADVTVAADGTGNYTSVTDAVLAAPDHSPRRYVIYVKRGVYKENVEIKRTKWNIAVIGQGMNSTLISGNRNHADGWTTFRSATFAVRGKGFMARDISFENTAGPGKQQAVALRSDSDLSVFYRCGVYGYQDTLYAHSLRQFYRECRITGTVDFIFGDGAVVFQNCQILARKGLPNQKNTVTAQGRKDPAEPTGFSLQFCNISADPDLQASIGANANDTAHSYLGRPWKMYSRTVVMQSYIGEAISPKGWLPWNASDFALATLFYGEYRNYGPSAGLNDRVNWTGFRVINDSNVANQFTVAQLIDGNAWLPATGVSFVAGLSD